MFNNRIMKNENRLFFRERYSYFSREVPAGTKVFLFLRGVGYLDEMDLIPLIAKAGGSPEMLINRSVRLIYKNCELIGIGLSKDNEVFMINSGTFQTAEEIFKAVYKKAA